VNADGSRYARRALTMPAMVLGLALGLALAPLALPLCALVDLARRRPGQPTVRLAAFFLSFAFTECVGLAQLFALWVACLGSRERLARRTWPVQRRYVAMHLWFVERLFALRFSVEGDELVTPGPLLVFIRHSSIVDTLIPGVFIANRHLIELKYVLKKELLVDPCLDVAGNWLPNHFVARDGADSEGEIARVRALKAGLQANQGVLLYPEGTRFTAGKRARALERLKGDPLALERASRLAHLLLPRPGGALALLDAAPPCDVLFVGHTGLEGFSSFKEIWSGRLTGRTIHIRFWRERAASIPTSREERLAWLQRCWERMDAWLSATTPAPAPAPPLRATG
jgi:1-acyl-sn-glycerol-3-phosphate acyltransferase